MCVFACAFILTGMTKKQSSRNVEQFHEFLKNLRKPAAEDVLSHLKM